MQLDHDEIFTKVKWDNFHGTDDNQGLLQYAERKDIMEQFSKTFTRPKKTYGEITDDKNLIQNVTRRKA